MIATLVVFLVASFACLTAVFYWLRYDAFKGLKNIQGPTPWPIIGNVLEITSKIDAIPQMCGFMDKYQLNVKGNVAIFPYFATADADMASIIFNSKDNIDKDRTYQFFYRWLGTGLLTSTGVKWMKRRKMITPTFHFKVLTNYVATFQEISEILINKLQDATSRATDGIIDVYPHVCLFTFDTLFETILGTKVNAQIDSNSDYVVSLRQLLNILTNRGFSAFKQSNLLYSLSLDYRREKRLVKKLHAFTHRIIQERRLKKIEVNPDQTDEFGIKNKIAFIDMLINATIDDKPLTDNDIREEVDTFVFEGIDTTSTAISFALYCISCHPEVQEKILAELSSIFKDDPTRRATFTDLQNMNYLGMVIKEVLRLYPSVPFFGRLLNKDIQHGDLHFRAGTGFFVYSFHMHRNPKYFEDPARFWPERFSVENASKMHPYCYVPFSAGHRNCVGQKFAGLVMKSALSRILRSFELLPDPTYTPILKFEVILKTDNGVNVRFKPRCLSKEMYSFN